MCFLAIFDKIKIPEKKKYKKYFLEFLFGKERAPLSNGQFIKVNINSQHHLM